jgi:tetratricopeptide (TPR) repeat protein/tRNA A-37 threonylcarbamoyl transferase component Bud32
VSETESPDDVDTRRTTPVSEPTTPRDDMPAWTGRELGRYLVLEPLGSGGMGEVYLAYDPKLDRRVALKVLRRDRNATPEAQDRLLREAQALARLSHPNVVAVHDVGTVEIGEIRTPAVYVAMEYVEGKTLRDWSAEHDHWRTIARMFHAAGLGLAAAHAVGIVHRDFKPTNVIVGGEGRPRVLDFGLARRLDQLPLLAAEDFDDSLERSSDGGESQIALHRSTVDPSLTETGVVLGTPAYMAPEQFRGTDIDARGDQFSFCVALYEGLWGTRPFGGRDPAKIIRAIRRQSFRVPKQHGGIPARLRAAVRKGLAFDPADRHADMASLLAEIDAVLRPLPRAAIAVGGVGLAVAAGAWWLAATPAAATATDPCAGVGEPLTRVWDDARRERIRQALADTELSYAADVSDKTLIQLDHWAEEWTQARTEACEATRVRGDQSAEMMDLRVACLDDRLGNLDALARELSKADREVVENAVQGAWGLPPVAPCADAKYLRAAVRPPDDPAVAATVATLRGELAAVRATVAIGKYAEGADGVVDLLSRTREVPYEPLHAEVALMAGQALERAGRLDEVRAHLEEALYAAERTGYGSVEAEALIGLTGYVGYQAADLANGMRYAEHARAVLDRIQRPEHLVAGLEVSTANSLLRGGKITEAIPHYETALAIPITSASLLRHNLAAAVNVGTAHAMAGDDRASLAALQIAAARTLAELGPRHPTYGTALMNLGATHWRLGELEIASERLAEAADIFEQGLGPDHPQLARVLHNQGAVLRDQGRLDDALVMYDRALVIKKKLHGKAHPTIALTASNKGDVLLEQGRYDLAEACLLEAIEAWESSVGPDHPDLANALSTLGRVRIEQHRPLEAIELLERAAKLRGDNAGHRDLWEQKLALARALTIATLDPDRARRLASEAKAHLEQNPAATARERAEVQAFVEQLGEPHP